MIYIDWVHMYAELHVIRSMQSEFHVFYSTYFTEAVPISV